MEIQDAENAVREIGTAAIDAVQGLDSATIEGSLPFIAGVLILLIAVKFLSLPFKLVWNGVIGAAALWLVNLIGAAVGIAGIFGVPGLLAVLCWEIFIK